MKTLSAIALAATLSLILGISCAAQYITPEQTGLNYSINVGVAFPVNSDVEDDTAPVLGITWYGPAGLNMGENAVVGLSFDWTEISRTGGGDVSLFPMLFNYGQYNRIGGFRVFANLGLGIMYADDNIPEMDIENGIQFAWALGASVDITEQLNLGVRFLASDSPGDDGLVIGQIGYRF